MSYDTGGYRERWCVPCTDLLSQLQRLIVTFSPDHRSLLLITPVDVVRVNTEQANELARDLHEAAPSADTAGNERRNVVGIYDAPPDRAVVETILGSIGDQVRSARAGRNWYLEDLAMRVGVSMSVICRLELARREASMTQLLTTCAVLNRRLSDLLRIAEDEAFPLGGAPWT